jgi:hypothetical protein
LINGVIALRENLRLRLAHGRIRAEGNYLSDNAPADVLQDSYSVSVQKHSQKRMFPSLVGVTAYAVEADARNDANAAEVPENRTGAQATGRMAGYAFEMGMRPTTRSRIELQHDARYLVYRIPDQERSGEYSMSNRIRYSHSFHDCTKLQGSYSTSAYSREVNLALARDRWNLKLSSAIDGEGGAMSVHVGYTIPLGRSASSRNVNCEGEGERMPAFKPLLEAAIDRPAMIPREPLAINE